MFITCTYTYIDERNWLTCVLEIEKIGSKSRLILVTQLLRNSGRKILRENVLEVRG